ncbi:hypothetical protein Hanom_Chr09g00822041 [Helianthus anomalus]
MFGMTGRRGEMRYEYRDRHGGCGGGNCDGDEGGGGEERMIEEKECLWCVYTVAELERILSGGRALRKIRFLH